ncbi:thiol:disulfide interchange protein DsbA [Proteus alimentorum]|uniref:Thiol:disulfide interchange protein n=1 Tax=Proteus alimentorum TaxID=1973495 RepID=A0ABS0IXC0_9GAMM|nr:thiol:disulfide interchange protein DsbA [Proteus alimentorum]MBG2874554.1 thiol:disulfide interchange protein DsbA [Proteus alimentorum]MBG2880687.1 thiol:disulfide interchange protein DsbA [Proteus alimentorum]
MKKIWLALASMVLAFSVSAADISEGKQYTNLSKTVAAAPDVVEFFSFYCPHCYQFSEVYKVNSTVEKNAPENTNIVRYHVDFLGPLGKDLTRSWAVAMALGVEDQVSPVLFKGIQETQSIRSVDDIRNAFIKAGVKGEDYDAAMNSFVVNSLVSQQQNAVADFQINGVPAMIIGGKYKMKNDGISAKSPEEYAKTYSDIVNQLLLKK